MTKRHNRNGFHALLATISVVTSTSAGLCQQKGELTILKKPPFVITTHKALADVLCPRLEKGLQEAAAASRALNIAVQEELQIVLLDTKAAAEDSRLKWQAPDYPGGTNTLGMCLAFVQLPGRDALTEAKQEAVIEEAIQQARKLFAQGLLTAKEAEGPFSFVEKIIETQVLVDRASGGSLTKAKAPDRIVTAARRVKQALDGGRPMRDMYVELLGLMRPEDFQTRVDIYALSLVAPYALMSMLEKPKHRQDFAAAIVKMVRGTAGTKGNKGEEVAMVYSKAMLEADGKKIDKKSDPVALISERLAKRIEELAAQK